jgi:glutathione S-transferase
MTTTTLRLYDYPASCNCYKVRLLLSQLGIPYERVPVDIFAGETLTHAYAKLNPQRTVPVLRTTDGAHLPDSSAILLYLAAGTELLPSDPLELAEVVRRMIFEQTDVIPTVGGLRFRLVTGRIAPDGPEARRRHAGGLKVLSLLEDHLRTRAFMVAGRYTVADIAIYGYAHLAGEAGFDLAAYPALEAWLARVREQPRYIEDVEPYGANAAPGAGRSIYDATPAEPTPLDQDVSRTARPRTT